MMRYAAVLPRVLLCLAPLVYGAWLAWHEWVFRQAMPAAPVFNFIAAAPAQRPEPLDPVAVATVFGLSTSDALARSAEPLQLRASFVASSGASRALLAGAQGQRIYQVGDRLPGGSVLRRIEVGRVVLWRNGREEWLALEQPVKRLLLAAGPSTGAESSIYLRPTSAKPQSE
ncbi:type II secretion system protein N [Pseudomonas agarici]|uniref:type II secretion system protein N n=1 Tax=Pseudomonas agarici TaxID=46677 RepID=UPI0003820B77|nr:type II secretion system protein N [Pseudomonas agarici]SEL77631.1 Type IV pilus biogenesis [Pseudomonas agarici]